MGSVEKVGQASYLLLMLVVIMVLTALMMIVMMTMDSSFPILITNHIHDHTSPQLQVTF
jgi:hypothetical protein